MFGGAECGQRLAIDSSWAAAVEGSIKALGFLAQPLMGDPVGLQLEINTHPPPPKLVKYPLLLLGDPLGWTHALFLQLRSLVALVGPGSSGGDSPSGGAQQRGLRHCLSHGWVPRGHWVSVHCTGTRHEMVSRFGCGLMPGAPVMLLVRLSTCGRL